LSEMSWGDAAEVREADMHRLTYTALRMTDKKQTESLRLSGALSLNKYIVVVLVST